MILPPKGLKQVYDTIKLESLRGGCTVLLLVAPDVDAIAACRIVTAALCADLISFHVIIFIVDRIERKKMCFISFGMHAFLRARNSKRAVFFFFFFFFPFFLQQIKPVAGYEDLIDANESLIRDNHELRSVIMLNCGGGIDLAKVRFRFFFFFFSPLKFASVFDFAGRSDLLCD
jgi:hypothetical protein